MIGDLGKNSPEKMVAIKKIHTLEERLRIIEEVDKNPSEKRVAIAKRLGLPPSTLNSIISKKKQIREQADKCGSFAKKRKTSKESNYSELESILYKWYQQCLASSIPVNGTVLRQMALQIAADNGIDHFSASNGWICRFKERHGLVLKKLSRENALVNIENLEVWYEKLPELLECYDDCDIYSAEEAGLFFNCLPDKTQALAGMTCDNGEFPEDRLTVLFCTNKDASDRRVPIVIGSSAKLQCFKNVKILPVTYHSNSKAWMTNEIFSVFLHDLDTSVITKRRKILLFIKNSFAHSPKILSLNHVKVIFYPLNCTSVVQPFDFGIIKCFKQLYRKKLMQRTLTLMGQEKDTNLKIDVLQAMHFIVAAWHEVSQSTIANSFLNCGFIKAKDEKSLLPMKVDADGKENEDFIQNDEWVRLCGSDLGLNFNAYVSVDEHLAVTGDGVDEVWDEFQMGNEEYVTPHQNHEDTETEPQQLPSFAQALSAFETVRTFIYSHEISETDQNNIINLENLLFKLKTHENTNE